MSITHAIDRFSSGSFAVSRAGAGSRAATGLYVEGAPTAFPSVAMAIQPIIGADLKVVPEGRRVDDIRLVLTKFALKTEDVVTYKGEPWVVFQAQDWNKRGVTWTRAYMARSTLDGVMS